jgi:hypothetical protein
MPDSFVEPIIEENNIVVETAIETETAPTWYPRPKYNVSSLDSFESRMDLDSHGGHMSYVMFC